MLSQMFPTIINVMTMRKKPIDNSFVKYAGCRLYLDITYLLANKFVSKQFANAFSGNDLPLKDVMHKMIDDHGKKLRKQGIKFKIPWGAFKYGLTMAGRMWQIRKIPDEQRYGAMIQVGEETYQKWLQKSKNLKTLKDKIDFIQNSMVAAFVLSQEQGLYATKMNDIKKIKNKVKKMYGNRFNMEHHDKEDIFFLFKKDILNKENLKDKIEINKANYKKEMERTSIPRIVLNTGETYYSAQKIDPGSKVIQGIPLSPGIYEGTIRVVFDPLNSNLQEGEIMVTESTNPAWTPLFAIAKGLIMEYGGPVSHGGIVAREYGIPAVVGIPSASNILKDGQRVRINGETGVVELL